MASQSRLSVLQAQLKPQQIILLSNPNDIHYYSQFEFLVPEEREALALIGPTQAWLCHNTFSPLPPNPSLTPNPFTYLPGCTPNKLIEHIQALKTQYPIKELLIDAQSLFVEEYLELQKLENISIKTFNHDLIWQQRCVKSSAELELLQASAKIARLAWHRLKKTIKTGVSERELKENLETIMRELGSERPAFPTIIAFGDHSALPHHQPTSRRLKPETPVLIDFGATYKGYRSDLSRSFWFGHAPTAEYQDVETVVKNAYQAALAKLKTHQSLRAKNLDDTTRGIITDAGYGSYFVHTTGHGLGLDIHEPPSLSWVNNQALLPNMAFTIEPGVYLPNKFGFRYENTIWYGEKEVSQLTLAK